MNNNPERKDRVWIVQTPAERPVFVHVIGRSAPDADRNAPQPAWAAFWARLFARHAA